MNKQQQEWFDIYLRTSDDVRAVEVAYPNVQKSGRSAKAGYLKRTLAQEIDKATREQYAQEAPKMLNVIKQLALECDQPAVRLKAADTWLSRAGHDATQVIEVKETQTHEQLIERLKIAATGIDSELLKSVLPADLINKLESKDNETQH